LPNARDGVVRAIARLRRTQLDHPATATRLREGAAMVGHRIVDRLVPDPTAAARRAFQHSRDWRPVPTNPRRAAVRRQVALQLTSERAIPLAVASVVLLAGLVSLGPVIAKPVGAGQSEAQPVRLAVGGAGGGSTADYDLTELPAHALSIADAALDAGDGTLFKPVAVDTTVESMSSKLRYHTVKAGETLQAIASSFGLSSETIGWANHLKTIDGIKAGVRLVIPPMNGLLVTVKAGDTLESLATQYKIPSASIVADNELSDPNLVVGQVLVMPNAKGTPIPLTTAAVTSRPRSTSSSSSSNTSFTYSGGSWAWPVVGGGNYISQYFHYGHLGVDIAASYGTPVVAALAGRVVYAGWKGNGGGYQVWISHGNGIYSAYYHMSSVLTSAGAVLARGQRLGRVGMSGIATGSHLMLEVWMGKPWSSSSYRVNPLRYY
jgi:LysM repeat protein